MGDHEATVEATTLDEKVGQLRGPAVDVSLNSALTKPAQTKQRHSNEIRRLGNVLAMEVTSRHEGVSVKPV